MCPEMSWCCLVLRSYEEQMRNKASTKTMRTTEYPGLSVAVKNQGTHLIYKAQSSQKALVQEIADGLQMELIELGELSNDTPKLERRALRRGRTWSSLSASMWCGHQTEMMNLSRDSSCKKHNAPVSLGRRG